MNKIEQIGPSWDFSHGPLRVSDNKRYLVHEDGTPFFWMGDTVWQLVHRQTREEAELFLETRRKQGFTVMQAVCLAELDGLNEPNSYGDRALIDNDPTKPNEAYWSHVDWIVKCAEAKGLYIGMLPTWGDKVVIMWGGGPVIFDQENARAYGKWLGERYKDSPNIIWILGGDRDPTGVEDVWRAMAAGLGEGDGGRHIRTFHPQGGMSSSSSFHNDEWLDFNMYQSGHYKLDIENFDMIAGDYNLTPVKPCLDGEPRYEDHPINWDPKSGWFDDFDCRQAAYWALFAGAFGHTYGCHDVWQCWTEERVPIAHARTPWPKAIELPGAWQMRHVRSLLLSRPFLSRVPDQSLILDGQQDGRDHVQATRASDGAYAMVYFPTGNAVTVDLTKLSGSTATAWWYDPRTGEATKIETYPTSGSQTFRPAQSGRGHDWVLVLDNEARGFTAPGRSE
jgi:hypothetical protein